MTKENLYKTLGVLHPVVLKRALNINIRPLIKKTLFLGWFSKSAKAYTEKLEQSKHAKKHFPFKWENALPILTEHKEQAAGIDEHYFLQDLYVARKIKEANPKRHVDIGSRFDGFIAHLLTFRDVEVVDVRPFEVPIKGLHFTQDDATELRNFKDNELESLSCLHAIEHFGLGRYGDPIDPDGPWKLSQAITRVLKPGGKLYLSTPIGKQTLYFNGHRVFSPDTIKDMFSDLTLKQFDAITPGYNYLEDTSFDEVKNERYACGIFMFEKENTK